MHTLYFLWFPFSSDWLSSVLVHSVTMVPSNPTSQHARTSFRWQHCLIPTHKSFHFMDWFSSLPLWAGGSFEYHYRFRCFSLYIPSLVWLHYISIMQNENQGPILVKSGCWWRNCPLENAGYSWSSCWRRTTRLVLLYSHSGSPPVESSSFARYVWWQRYHHRGWHRLCFVRWKQIYSQLLSTKQPSFDSSCSLGLEKFLGWRFWIHCAISSKHEISSYSRQHKPLQSSKGESRCPKIESC